MPKNHRHHVHPRRGDAGAAAAAVAVRGAAAVAIAGVGTIGTQVLIYGLVSNYYPTRARAAGVAWCAGFGRLGGIVGPVIGGLLVGAGVGGSIAFLIFARLAVLGAAVTALVPRKQAARPAPTGRRRWPSHLRCDCDHRGRRVRRP